MEQAEDCSQTDRQTDGLTDIYAVLYVPVNMKKEKKIGALYEKLENSCPNLGLIHATNMTASVLAYLETFSDF